MLTEYIEAAMRHARYEILEDDDTYFGHIPACQGVWANADTLAACRDELQEVLEDWITVRLLDHLEIPEIDGLGVGAVTAA